MKLLDSNAVKALPFLPPPPPSHSLLPSLFLYFKQLLFPESVAIFPQVAYTFCILQQRGEGLSFSVECEVPRTDSGKF